MKAGCCYTAVSRFFWSGMAVSLAIHFSFTTFAKEEYKADTQKIEISLLS